MQTTFRLGRVAGVEIGLNWSWFFVFALIVWSLSESGSRADQRTTTALAS